MKEQVRSIFRALRNFLFSIVNREFLIFLFFLAVAGTFWLLTALNETYEREFEVPVKLTNVPRDVVITTEMNDTVRVTVRDKGFTLATYMYGDGLQPLLFNYKTYTARDNGYAQIPSADIQKQIYQHLYGSSRITSLKPDRLEFYYNHGISKKVPVRIVGQIEAVNNRYIAHTLISPSNVVVYASKNLMDSIRFVNSESLRILNVEDTVELTVKLKAIKGAKIVPNEVKVTVCPDILTEESVEVPIEAVNMPEGKVLRTFPSRVKVRFVAGARQYRSIRADQFRVEADYNEIAGSSSDKCNIYLREKPANVRSAQLDISQVDYLVEQ
ncbi:MAG: YbbR-like domain-containing protein [Prevotella sp.]|nr:YbbR-like domain-containing protein [Prevotella sp.]